MTAAAGGAAGGTPTVTTHALEHDPYPVYARLRAQAPVAWVPSVGLWLVTRWDDVRRIDQDPDLAFAHGIATWMKRRGQTIEIEIDGSKTTFRATGPIDETAGRIVEALSRRR